MTATRLRQIAQLIESQCIELRTLKRMEIASTRVPCNQCGTAARELCDLARQQDQKEVKALGAIGRTEVVQ